MNSNQQYIAVKPVEDSIKVVDSIAKSSAAALSLSLFVIIALSLFIFWLLKKEEKNSKVLQDLLVDATKNSLNSINALEKIVEGHKEVRDEVCQLRDDVREQYFKIQEKLSQLQAK